MDSATAARLIAINQDFYSRFGDSFSATRRRIQPGVRRVMQMFQGDESILDLGCGNGEFARELVETIGHTAAQTTASILVTSFDVRRAVRKLIEPALFDLPVLAFNELSATIRFEVVGQISLPNGMLEAGQEAEPSAVIAAE